MTLDLDEVRKYTPDENVEPARVLAICADLFPDDKNERNVLNLVYKAGILSDIMGCQNIDKMQVNRWILILVNDFSVQRGPAVFAVCQWVKYYHNVDFYSEIPNPPPVNPPLVNPPTANSVLKYMLINVAVVVVVVVGGLGMYLYANNEEVENEINQIDTGATKELTKEDRIAETKQVLSLEGIYIYDSVDKVENILGKPLEIKKKGDKDIYTFMTYIYDKCEVFFMTKAHLEQAVGKMQGFEQAKPTEYFVVSVSTKSKEMRTPGGICIGMPESELLEIYGEPDGHGVARKKIDCYYNHKRNVKADGGLDFTIENGFVAEIKLQVNM